MHRRGWAAWPERFKEEITNGIIFELDGKALNSPLTNGGLMYLYDHIPCARESTTCLKGAGRGRPHRKVPHPDAMTLSLDVCGPFRPGEDYRKRARYFLVGVCAIPVRKTSDGEDPPEDVEGPLLPELEGEELEVESQDVLIKNYTLVETLTSRHASELKSGIARMVARLKYLGMEVRRIHSDAAGEMRCTKRWCEERSIYRTFTSGSDWKANGRAEAEIGIIRRSINTLIRSSGEGEEQWPLMAKHVGERRGRLQLQALGFTTPALLPWGRKVMVTTKGWDDNSKGTGEQEKSPVSFEGQIRT